MRRELERLLSGVAGNGRKADEGKAPADQAGVARSDARAGSNHWAVAQAGGIGLLPISCRAGESMAVGAFPLAAGSIVAICTAPPKPEVAGDLEGGRSHLRPVDSCTAHPASLPECAFRRSYPREEPYALAAPVRICAGGGQRWPSLPRPKIAPSPHRTILWRHAVRC